MRSVEWRKQQMMSCALLLTVIGAVCGVAWLKLPYRARVGKCGVLLPLLRVATVLLLVE